MRLLFMMMQKGVFRQRPPPPPHPPSPPSSSSNFPSCSTKLGFHQSLSGKPPKPSKPSKPSQPPQPSTLNLLDPEPYTGFWMSAEGVHCWLKSGLRAEGLALRAWGALFGLREPKP